MRSRRITLMAEPRSEDAGWPGECARWSADLRGRWPVGSYQLGRADRGDLGTRGATVTPASSGNGSAAWPVT